jgi:hypothetical protein
MKSSVSPAGFLTALILLVLATGALAQDVLVIKQDNSRREGKILGVQNGAVRFQVGPSTKGVPLTAIASVEMAPPKDLESITAALRAGVNEQTLQRLDAFVKNWNGLPIDWAERAASLQVEALLDSGKTAEASAAYDAFRKTYPSAGLSSDLLAARMAIQSKDLSSARAKLAPLVAEAGKTLLPVPEKNATLGQALTMMGEINESEGKLSDALNNFVLVSTIYRGDAASVAKAEAKIKALEAQNIYVP